MNDTSSDCFHRQKRRFATVDRRGILVAGATVGAIGLFARASAIASSTSASPVVNVTDRGFGADPTGRSNSTAAFQAAAHAINAAGGGRMVIPPGTYRVGHQTLGRDRRWSYAPEAIIELRNCLRPVAVEGAGAKLMAESGLRFGSFDRNSGKRLVPHSPSTDLALRASPYTAMIGLYGNRGAVTVTGLELDGRSAEYLLGGPWNDRGIQISNSGIEAYGNSDLRIEDVYSHHHGLDGIMIGHDGLTASAPPYPHVLSGCRFEDNGRQGLSWVGGNSLVAVDCTFLRSGRGPVATAPSAGVDIEPENSVCINAHFTRCDFGENGGVGMLAHPSGLCEGHLFSECRFIGTAQWAAWPAATRSVFKDCLFVGGVANAHADRDPIRATRFSNCRFSADPLLSPNGQVYSQNYLTVEMDGLENVRFERCRFDSPRGLQKGIVFANGGLFTDCTFDQRGSGLGVFHSTFAGRTTITTAGTLDFSGARFLAPVMVNGARVG